MAADLQAHKGSSVVVAGDRQPAAVHALARAMNEALGNVGATVTYGPRLDASPADGTASIAELVADMNAGRVDVLIILGGNPVFTAPADLAFGEALNKVGMRVHLGLYYDETAAACQWHVPEAHYLESWGDARSFDGTVTFTQPLIAPLYGGRQAIEMLAVLNGEAGQSPMDLVKAYWTKAFDGQTRASWTMANSKGQAFASADALWRNALHDGFLAGTGVLSASAAAPAAPAAAAAARGAKPAPAPAAGATPTAPAQVPAVPAPAVPVATGTEIVFLPDPNILDGRHINNGWLQEMPKPLSKVTWDNVAYVDIQSASRLGISNGDVIDVTYRLADRARAGLGHAGHGRGHRRRALRLRAPQDGTRRHRRRRRHVRPAHVQGPLVRRRRAHREDRRDLRARVHAEPLRDGRPASRAGRRHRRVPRQPEAVGGRAGSRAAAAGALALPGLRIQGPQVGHGDRSQLVHRLPACASRRARPRTTFPSSARRRSSAAARCTGSAWTRTSRAIPPRPRASITSPCRACSARTRRARSSAPSPPPCTATKA